MTAQPALRIADGTGRRKPIRKKLTQAWCRSVKAPSEGRLIAYDTTTPGLALQVTSNGARAFYIIRKLHGRARRWKVADGNVALEDVRKLAVKQWAAAIDGTDPVAERKRKRQRVETLGELWDRYGEDKVRTPRTVRAEASLWKHVGHLKRRSLDSIQPEDITALHRRVGKDAGKVSANRVVQIIRRLYRWAYKQHLHRGVNPAEGLDLNPEHTRERYVRPSELRALLAAIDAEAEPWPDYFRLLLLTGARRSALASMKWGDVDLNAGTWAIPAADSKNKTGVTVALVPEAVERLEKRRKAMRADEPYAFPATSEAGHVVNPYEAWKRIRDEAGLSDLTMHDLRRTTGSYLAAAGVSLPVIGRALGHRSTSSTAIYARLDVADVRKELAHVADALTAATPKKKPAKKKATGKGKARKGGK